MSDLTTADQPATEGVPADAVPADAVPADAVLVDAGRRRAGALSAGLVLAATFAAPPLAAGTQGRPGVPVFAAVSYSAVAVPTLFVAAGLLLVWKRPRNRLGWLFIAVGACDGLNVFFGAYGTRALAMPGTHLPGGVAAVWIATWIWLPGALGVPSLLLLFYPSGRLPARRWWPVAAAALTGIGLITLGAAVADDTFDDFTTQVNNPLAAPHWAEVTLLAAGGLLATSAVLVSLALAGWRLWHSQRPERAQLALLFFAIVLEFAALFLAPWEWPLNVALGLIPTATVVGVLRYRLLDIEIVIRRTLIFGVLTGLVVLASVAATAAVSSVLSDGPAPVVAAAVLVVVGIAPARDLVQRAVDRLLYGDRRDPMAALNRVGDQVRAASAGELLPAVLAAVAVAMRAPGAQILDPAARIVAATGSPSQRFGRDAARAGLRYAGLELGELVVSGRGDGRYRAEERRLLATLAPQVAVVVHAAALAADLEAARERVLTAAVTERARLRRDLHDGLGPSLAGMALGLQTAEAVVETDPAATRPVLTRLREEMDGAVAEVLRLVDGLRPPALDELGLLGALEAYADSVTLRSGGRIRVAVHAEHPMQRLTADTEVAAYRIATEAVTNALRHAGASTCSVTLAGQAHTLTLNIDDDGCGLPEQRHVGVGLGSMRERAEVLGGTFTIRSDHTGTHVSAELPTAAPAGSTR